MTKNRAGFATEPDTDFVCFRIFMFKIIYFDFGFWALTSLSWEIYPKFKAFLIFLKSWKLTQNIQRAEKLSIQMPYKAMLVLTGIKIYKRCVFVQLCNKIMYFLNLQQKIFIDQKNIPD